MGTRPPAAALQKPLGGQNDDNSLFVSNPPPSVNADPPTLPRENSGGRSLLPRTMYLTPSFLGRKKTPDPFLGLLGLL